MKELLKYTLILLLIFILALMCKAQQKEFLSTKIMNQYHSEVDSSTVITLKNPVIQIRDKVFIAEKRKVFYSVEDYIVYDEYKIDKTIITFYIDPDTSEIIMVAMKTDCLIYYK